VGLPPTEHISLSLSFSGHAEAEYPPHLSSVYASLTTSRYPAQTRGRADRYSFPVRLFHPLLHAAQHLDYREGRSLIIPYYRLPLWEDGQKTEIHEIVVGPTRDVERSIKSVSRLIKGRNVIKDRNMKGLELINGGYTSIKPSQVPYRDW
jgi:hypothetical protein